MKLLFHCSGSIEYRAAFSVAKKIWNSSLRNERRAPPEPSYRTSRFGAIRYPMEAKIILVMCSPVTIARRLLTLGVTGFIDSSITTEKRILQNDSALSFTNSSLILLFLCARGPGEIMPARSASADYAAGRNISIISRGPWTVPAVASGGGGDLFWYFFGSSQKRTKEAIWLFIEYPNRTCLSEAVMPPPRGWNKRGSTGLFDYRICLW